MPMEPAALAALCSLAGALGGKGIDLLVQKTRSSGRKNESEAARFARDTREFRQELQVQIREMRGEMDKVEEEARRLDHENADLRRQVGEERIGKQALEQEVRQLRADQERDRQEKAARHVLVTALRDEIEELRQEMRIARNRGGRHGQ